MTAPGRTPHRREHLLRWALPLAWMVVIFAISDRSTLPYPPDVSSQVVSVAGHFTVYAVLAALLWWSLGLVIHRERTRFLVAIVVVLLYGISDEWHQSFVPGRQPDIRDVIVDCLGAITGLTLIWWWRHRQGDQTDSG